MSDEPFATDELAVVERLLGPARMTRWPAGPGVVAAVGDGETEYAVAEQQGQGRFEERQRGSVNETVTASTVAVALRFLTYRLARVARPTTWPVINPPDYPPGVRLETVDGGQRLSWGDDWLLFDRRSSVEWLARPLSWVVRATPAEVAASYLDPAGAPLFAST